MFPLSYFQMHTYTHVLSEYEFCKEFSEIFIFSQRKLNPKLKESENVK